MRALVTGAGGFIASHLVEALVREGHRVTALVHYHGSGGLGRLADVPPEVLRGLSVVHGDVLDAEHMRTLVRVADVVFHMAANPSISHSYVEPRSVIEANILGTLNVLEAVKAAHEGPRMVMMASSEGYGSAQGAEPMTEAHVLRPQSPYGASKAAADLLCQSYAMAFGVDVRIARAFNVYGPRQGMRSVIPNIVAQVLRAPEGAEVDVKIGSMTVERDYTYATDTAAALCALGIHDPPGWVDPIGPWNIGTGMAISLPEIVRCVGYVLNRSVTPGIDPALVRPKRSDIQRLLCDASAFRKAFGWAPSVPFVEGLRHTAAWVEGRLGTLDPDAAILPREHRGTGPAALPQGPEAPSGAKP